MTFEPYSLSRTLAFEHVPGIKFMPLHKDEVAFIELPITALLVSPSHSLPQNIKAVYLSIFNTVPENKRQSLCISIQITAHNIQNNQHSLQKPCGQNTGSKFPQIRNISV
jgi:hypothetical protein